MLIKNKHLDYLWHTSTQPSKQTRVTNNYSLSPRDLPAAVIKLDLED